MFTHQPAAVDTGTGGQWRSTALKAEFLAQTLATRNIRLNSLEPHAHECAYEHHGGGSAAKRGEGLAHSKML